MEQEILAFMQREDRNGIWLEWLAEIEAKESFFDVDYVISVLNAWYADSQDEKYLIRINQLKGVA